MWEKRAPLCREIDGEEVALTSVSPHAFNDLAIELVGELCKRTREAPTEEAPREALHALLPWVDPADIPHQPHAALSLLKDDHRDHHGIALVILI